MPTLSTDEVLEAVGQWSLLQINEFVKKFEEKFEVSAAAPVAMAMAAGPAAPAAEVEEKTEFDLILTGAGADKIKVIKEVRVLVPSLGLKEAKELVDGAPKAVLTGASKEDAEKGKKALEAVGATVEIK